LSFWLLWPVGLDMFMGASKRLCLFGFGNLPGRTDKWLEHAHLLLVDGAGVRVRNQLNHVTAGGERRRSPGWHKTFFGNKTQLALFHPGWPGIVNHRLIFRLFCRKKKSEDLFDEPREFK
jgi:hypothetical protein